MSTFAAAGKGPPVRDVPGSASKIFSRLGSASGTSASIPRPVRADIDCTRTELIAPQIDFIHIEPNHDIAERAAHVDAIDFYLCRPKPEILSCHRLLPPAATRLVP